MKKLLGIISFGALLAGCGKVITYSNDFASAAFVNAAPFVTPPATSPTINMRVFIDTIQKTSSNVTYTSSSGYLSVAPGTHSIQIRSSLDFLTILASAPGQQFVSNTASTFFVYDTLDNVTGRAKLLRLKDTLSLPATGNIKVRFVPLAVNTPTVDVTFLRTSVTPNDSVTLYNYSYVSANPSTTLIDRLSAFREIPLGAYTVKVKTANTQTVLVSQALSLANVAGTGNVTGINSIFITGTAKGQPLRVGLFRHYP